MFALFTSLVFGSAALLFQPATAVEYTPAERDAFHTAFASLVANALADAEASWQLNCGLSNPDGGGSAMTMNEILGNLDSNVLESCTTPYREFTEVMGCASLISGQTSLLDVFQTLVEHPGFSNFGSLLDTDYQSIVNALSDWDSEFCTCNAFDNTLAALKPGTSTRAAFDQSMSNIVHDSENDLGLKFGVGSTFHANFYRTHFDDVCSTTPNHFVTAFSVCVAGRESLFSSALSLFVTDFLFSDLKQCDGYNSGDTAFWFEHTCLLDALPLVDPGPDSEFNMQVVMNPFLEPIAQGVQDAAFQACGAALAGGGGGGVDGNDVELTVISVTDDLEPKVIQDGPEDEFYDSEVNQAWHIIAPEGYRIRIHFTRISTEDDFDLVRVYDGDTTEAPIIREASGLYLLADDPLLTEPVVTTGSAMYITFKSDDSVEGFGFAAVVAAVEPGITNPNDLSNPYDVVKLPYGDALVYFSLAQLSANIEVEERALDSKFHFVRVFPGLPDYQVYTVFSRIDVPNNCEMHFYEGDLSSEMKSAIVDKNGFSSEPLRSYSAGRRPYFSHISQSGSTSMLLTCSSTGPNFTDESTVFRVRYASDRITRQRLESDAPHCRFAGAGAEKCAERSAERVALGLGTCDFFTERYWSYARRRFVIHGCQDSDYCRFQDVQACGTYDRCERFNGLCLNKPVPQIGNAPFHNQCSRNGRPESECDPENCAYVQATVSHLNGGHPRTFTYGCQEANFCAMNRVPHAYRSQNKEADARREQCAEHELRGCVFDESQLECVYSGGVVDGGDGGTLDGAP